MRPAGANLPLRALRVAAWALLWGAAALAVSLSAAALLAVLPVTRPLAATALVRWADDAVAGRLTLDGIAVLPDGGVELRGLRAFDPEGTPVLRVERARLFLASFDVAERRLGITASLSGLEVDAARRGADGELALARAFGPVRAPARAPSPGGGGRAEPSRADGRGWTFDVSGLEIEDARVLAEWPGAGAVDAFGLRLTARGRWAAAGAWLELRAAGRLASPAEAPLSLELRAARAGERIGLERLVAMLGRDRLEAVGEGDLDRRTGRIAVTRLEVSRGDAGAFAPAARLGGALAATLYAESDGTLATAALQVAPGDPGGGRARVAAAARLPSAAGGWGFHADLERFDPSRLSLLSPPGRITLRARGAAKGTRLAELSGRLEVRLEPSRLRGGAIGPVDLEAAAEGGSVDVARLEAAAPGGGIAGRLRWRAGGDVAGELRVTARDLDVLEGNLAALLGRSLPDLEGSGRASVTLSGSAAAPRVAAEVEAPRLGIDRFRAEGARLHVELRGPAARPSGRVRGGLDGARVGGLELRAVELEAALGEEQAALAFTASAPKLGTDPIRAVARGRWGPLRSHFLLEEGLVAWPGTRFALVDPARIDPTGPGVDRLILEADAQRLELSGGVSPAGILDARLRVTHLDLARLPRGLAPPGADLEGLLAVDARVSGTRAAPRIDATVGLSGASAWQVGGLQLLGELAWDGGTDRIEADLGLLRARGGAIDLSLDLPLALGRARAGEGVRVELRGRGVPIDELVWLAGSYALVAGDLDLDAVLTGSVGAPRLDAAISARDGAWEDLEGLGLDAKVEADGARARVRAKGTLEGAGAAIAEADAGLDLGALLARPGEAWAAARRAAGSLALRMTGFDLRPLAGHLRLPPDLGGRIDVEADLAGAPAGPRGTARLSVAQGTGWGARAVRGKLDLALAPERTGATLALALGERPAVDLDGSIDLPAERLLDRAAVAAAPFRADAVVTRSDLAAWGGELLALRGTVAGRAALRGTAGAPQGELQLVAEDAVVEGRPLGAVSVSGRYAGQRTTLSVDLRPAAGGALHADASLDRPLGLGGGAGPLREAPAELRVAAERLDLGFLPALAPGIVRAAAGAAELDLQAAGPLGRLRPRGTLRVAKGRLALAELGEWTDAAIEVTVGDDVAELRRFEVRKGAGRLVLRGALRGLSRDGGPAEVEATLRSEGFGVERAGMELVRIDLTGEARGQLTREALTLGIVVPQAEVKLPKRIPRTLQETGGRKDITVGRPAPARPRRARPGEPPPAGVAAPPAEEPFRTILHLVAPRRLRVRADSPRIDVELKADALLAFAGAREEATGSVEVVRGQVEPLGGRVFEVRRGKVTFTGGRIAGGVLDVVAEYDNPSAKVTATVGGTLGKPQLTLTSEPPMDEARIALLVATGRTEVKAGTGGVNTLAAGEAGLAAAGALLTGVFKDLLSDKLPLDSVALDSTGASVGKYLTDRLYVGYVRRFDAKVEKGENPDEVRFEYQLAPGWQVETRYGSGQSGGASIVWTRTY